MSYVLGAALVVAALLWVTSPEERQPCSAEGDVRYVADQRYVCEPTILNGLRWTAGA